MGVNPSHDGRPPSPPPASRRPPALSSPAAAFVPAGAATRGRADPWSQLLTSPEPGRFVVDHVATDAAAHKEDLHDAEAHGAAVHG